MTLLECVIKGIEIGVIALFAILVPALGCLIVAGIIGVIGQFAEGSDEK